MGFDIVSHKYLHCHLAKPPRITLQPQELKDAVPGKHVTFTVQATGTVPLSTSGNYILKMRVESGSRVMWRDFQEQTTPHSPSHVCRSLMRGATAVLSATLLIAGFLNQYTLALVRFRYYNCTTDFV